MIKLLKALSLGIDLEFPWYRSTDLETKIMLSLHLRGSKGAGSGPGEFLCRAVSPLAVV